MQNKVSRFRIVAGLLGVLLLVGVIFSLPTHAVANVIGVTMSPVVKDFEISPGQSVTDEYIVFNSGQTNYDFLTYPNKFAITGEDYNTSVESSDPMADVNEWIKVGTPSGHLDGGKMTHIPFTITVPVNATPGAHTGVIFAQNTVDPSTQTASGVATEKRVGMTIYVNVKGGLALKGGVVTDIPFLQTTSPLQTHLRYTNDGNGFYVADASMQVYDALGKKVYDTNALQYTVLPQKPRKADIDWAGASWFGLYRVRLTTTVLGQTTSKDSYVMIVPVWLVMLVGLTVVSGGAYAASRLSRRRRS